MTKNSFFIILIFLISGRGMGQEQQVVSGKLEHHQDFSSKFVEPRNVDVWLPESYDGEKKFAVVYMHDGQMLFDSTTTWNKQAWDVDDVAFELLKKDLLKDFIVVGIWNTEKRHENYFPQKPFEDLSASQKAEIFESLKKQGATEMFQPNSDDYLKFVVQELKPYIEENYAVRKDRENTFMAGSSMGGLISIYAISEYPEVFGGVAALSTHWPGLSLENNPIPQKFVEYLEKNLPDPGSHRIYFDLGDQTLDAMYPELQKKVDEVMRKKGFTSDNWITRYFPGQDHSEKSWKSRLEAPLLFLLGK